MIMTTTMTMMTTMTRMMCAFAWVGAANFSGIWKCRYVVSIHDLLKPPPFLEGMALHANRKPVETAVSGMRLRVLQT